MTLRVTLFRDLPTERWWSMERYADELGGALKQIGCNVQTYVAARPLPELRGTANVFANYFWRSFIYPPIARRHQGDVNHVIDHSYAHLLTTLDARRTVVTCHDLAPLALGEGRGISRRLWDHSFRSMQRAAHLIADSGFTRSEILRWTNYPAERITVVPLAVGKDFFGVVDDSDVRRLREGYQFTGNKIVLHVGTCAPRKNIELILRALVKMPNCVFVQIGGYFSAVQSDLLDVLDLRRRTIQIHSVSENELRAWYRIAGLFVFPSRYEGFGLPVLEAMACGTPVICSNTSSLPEVAGNAALLVNANDPAQFADAIRGVLTDSQLAADLRARGMERARQFSWERTTRSTLDVYKKLQ